MTVLFLVAFSLLLLRALWPEQTSDLADELVAWIRGLRRHGEARRQRRLEQQDEPPDPDDWFDARNNHPSGK